MNGDTLMTDMGLSKTDLETVRRTVSIVVHSASSINLSKPLHCLSQSIIQASERVAELSLTLDNFERFVYVSTAYANTHLHARSQVPGFDVDIKEDVYCLENQGNPVDEWNDVKHLGTSKAYESEDFPWAYAYAKHLTERLLLYRFDQSAAKNKLLIVRPSIIGPAQRFPFPGYSMPLSTPSTMLAAALALEPYWRWKIATQMPAPEMQIQVDEVPVDVVVDRILSHLAAGNHGCVHAVSGRRARVTCQEWWKQFMSLRRIPWAVRPLWLEMDWKSREQHRTSRLYVILGTSFAFSEDRTVALSHEVDQEKSPDLQLFTRINMENCLLIRAKHIRYVMEMFAQKSWGAWLVFHVFYRNFGVET